VSESDEHKAIVRYFRDKWPHYQLSLRVSANGIHRGKGQAAMRRIAKEKAHGFITGESDISILLPRGGFGSLIIEHKAGDAARGATESQREYLDYHNTIGNCACETRGIAMAIAAIDTYMSLPNITQQVSL